MASLIDMAEYTVPESERRLFHGKWCGPDVLPHGEATLVARYRARRGGDGRAVKVVCTAMPARFYTIEVGGMELETGSDCSLLAATVAFALSDGMLSIRHLRTQRRGKVQ